VDVNLFGRVVELTFGQNVDHLPDAFLADRAALRGAPLDREALKKAVPLAEQNLKAQLAWIEIGLSGSQPFINGEHPGPGDFTLYATLWFARVGRFDVTRFPAIDTWMERIRDFGHGTPTDMSADDALAVALAAEPAPLGYESVSPDPSGVALGQQVSVAPESLGHGTAVSGELVGINAERMAVKLTSSRCGTVHVHFLRTVA
jgi:glutathione S-transferase